MRLSLTSYSLWICLRVKCSESVEIFKASVHWSTKKKIQTHSHLLLRALINTTLVFSTPIQCCLETTCHCNTARNITTWDFTPDSVNVACMQSIEKWCKKWGNFFLCFNIFKKVSVVKPFLTRLYLSLHIWRRKFPSEKAPTVFS